jgi:Predicted hydrolase of the metallo-beta-lactamase superfamily
LIRRKLSKQQLPKLSSVNYGQNIHVTPRLSAEFLQVTHSIPQSSMINIQSSEGDIVYACDYKFDDHSKVAKTNYKKLKSIGRQGVKCLVVEALNVDADGKSESEKVARAKVRDSMSFAHESGGLIVGTTFSTHIERIQSLVKEANKLGRKVVILGNSYVPNCSLGEKLGLLDMPDGTIVSGRKPDNVLSKVAKERDKYFVLATGHQGEPGSILSRVVDGKLKFRFKKGDSLLFSSKTIPSDVNIANRGQMVDKMKISG